MNAVQKTLAGVQFLFVAFGATVLVPLLVGLDPSTALFSAGIGTLIFHLVTKGKVPIYLGSSFAFITPIITASAQWGLPGALTSFIGVAFVYFVVAAIVKWKGLGLLNRIFPPVVIGPVIILIGLSLAGTAVDMAKTDWLLALIALVVAVVIMFFGRGLVKLLPVLGGVIVGYLVAICLGKVDFTAVVDAPWLSLPSNIRDPHMPKIAWEPLVFMMPIALAAVVEHVGDVYTVGSVAGKDFASDPGLHRTMMGDGLACLAAALLGGPPVTTYSEVTGAMQVTRITDPKVLRITAIAALLFSVFGKLNGVLQSIPQAVLGGIMLLLFGTIATVGVQNLIRNKVNFDETRNLIIAGVTLTVGIGGAVLEAGTFVLSGVGLAAVVGILLNLILPRPKAAKE
ncbi:MAG: uracil-xanthine permease family protein [Bacteroidales bacterium]|nr:uracil-xanthine permease family protein [Bacteroidales bacterium]